MNKSYFAYNYWWSFVVLSGLSVLFLFGMNYLFLTDDTLYYQTFGTQLASERIEIMIKLFQRWKWTSYVVSPVTIFLRVVYVSMCLYVGFIFYDLKINFKDLLKTTFLADFIYVISTLFKLVLLIFVKNISTLKDLQFQPLSIMELLDENTVDNLFVYPLSLLNLFELIYFLVLALLLTQVVNVECKGINFTYGKSLRLVTASYGSGLLLWVVLVMFLTLNLT